MTAGLEINVIQPWNALAMCLRVFYQGPWLEGEEKGVFFVPFLPVIIFIMNLSLSFRQLGPVPRWRDLQSTRAASHAWLFPEITWLEIQSPPTFFFFIRKQFHWIPKHLYSEFVWLRDLLSTENEKGPIFTLKQTASLGTKIFEMISHCFLSNREASYNSVSSVG